MQKEIIQNCVEEGLNFNEIQKELQKQFGEHAYKRSNIYKYMQEVKLGSFQVEDSQYNGERIDEQLLVRIQQEINENENFSVRSLAHKLGVSPSTIHRYLTEELHLVYKHTKWVPHSLNSNQKKRRQEESLDLFQVLTKSKHNSYRDIITGDQSWFLYNYAPKGKWVLGDDEAPSFPNPGIFTEKMMITVIWGVFGTYIIDDLPEGQYLNSQYFIEHILKPLEAQKQIIWPGRGKHKIYLHLDNCRVHNSHDTEEEIQKSVFKRAPHPPYSPDLAPSDFFLFGYVKGQLNGHSFKTREELYDAIATIIQGISIEKKRLVFDEWMERCHWVSTHEGNYYQP